MTHVLRARRLLTEEGWLDDHQLRIADGVIAAIEPIPVGVTERDAELLCPAYIDTHVHGGAGVDVMDDAADLVRKCWGVISKDRTSRRRIKARIRRNCFASLKLPSWIN